MLIMAILFAPAAGPARGEAGPMDCAYTHFALPDGSDIQTIFDHQVSGNGRFLVFNALYNGIPGGPENSYETFVYDRETDLIAHVSIRTDGGMVYSPEDYTTPPVISDDGRIVAFGSSSTNLVHDYGKNNPHIYSHDRQTGVTGLVSISEGARVRRPGAFTPAMSAFGRYVVFQSWDGAILIPDDTNNTMDVVLRDLRAGKYERISIASDGSQGEDSSDYGYSSLAISAGGRFVAFNYESLKDDDGVLRSGIFIRDRAEKRTHFVANGLYPDLSDDGRYLVFLSREALAAADTNDSFDLYLYDRDTQAFTLLSTQPDGSPRPPAQAGSDFYEGLSRPRISGNGQAVVYSASDPHLTGAGDNTAHILLHNLLTGQTRTLTAAADGPSSRPTISNDGRTIAFQSGAGNLVAGVSGPVIYFCNLAPEPIEEPFLLFLPVIGKEN
jgi:Tol biopolymer transport system component